MIRLIAAFILMYGTVGGIETDMYYTWLQPAALFALSGLIVFWVIADGTLERLNREDK